ncbi:MAG: hypothetical protein Q4G26_08935 [Paracoccus sp. (in: a-proteobacteria)]|nr:hypothetical protein [Paracoccus sp. (in: a-proteobacteria)]
MAPTRRFVTRLALSVLFIMALVLAAFLLFAPVTLPGGLTLSLGNRAETILRGMAPDKALMRETGVVEISPRDGPAPEMALRSYELLAPAAALRDALATTCGDAGLAPPSAPRSEGGADLICTGQQDGAQVNVFLFLECGAPGCPAGLWVHAY